MHFEASDEMIREWHSEGRLGTTGEVPDPVLSLGDRGPEIAALQRRLNELGAGLSVDGVLGPATRAAVVAFQARSGLSPMGWWGRRPKQRWISRDRHALRLRPVARCALRLGMHAGLAGARGRSGRQRLHVNPAADCRAPPPELQREFAAKDLGVQECPAPADWQLLFVASDANSWLEVRRNDLRWSAEDPVVYDKPIGLFPNVGGASVVEWRQDDQGRPQALIFRVVAQDPGDPAGRVSRLFVVRIRQDAACLIGRVPTNEAARTLADGPVSCSGAT